MLVLSTACQFPPEVGKQELRLGNLIQTSTQQEQGQKIRHTHPQKQVPRMQPRPISHQEKKQGQKSPSATCIEWTSARPYSATYDPPPSLGTEINVAFKKPDKVRHIISCCVG